MNYSQVIIGIALLAVSCSLASCECGADCAGVVLSKKDSLAVAGATVQCYAGDKKEGSSLTDSAGHFTAAYFVGSSRSKCPILYIEVSKEGFKTQHLQPPLELADTVWLEPE